MSLEYWKRCLTHLTFFQAYFHQFSPEHPVDSSLCTTERLNWMISISFFCSSVFNSFFVLKGSRWSAFTTELGHTPEIKFFVAPQHKWSVEIYIPPPSHCMFFITSAFAYSQKSVSMLCIWHITQFNSYLFFETVPQPHKHLLNVFIILKAII